MKLGLLIKRPMVIFGGAACTGLTLARVLNELVPDALGIGVSMFAAGALGGFVAGVLYRDRRVNVARAAARGLEKIEHLHHHDKE